MTNPLSGSGDGARISTTVKQYDPAKGYGFLVPVDGPPEIFCRDSALAAVGLETLLAGTTVSCETVQGRRGPEVARILAVDFSTASSGPATPAPAPVNPRMAAGPGVSGRVVRAPVKWFHPVKGYGFLKPEDGSVDVFCHLTAVQESGRDTLPSSAVVTGIRVARASTITPQTVMHGPATAGREDEVQKIRDFILDHHLRSGYESIYVRVALAASRTRR